MKKLLLPFVILLITSGCSVQDEYFTWECSDVIKTTDTTDKIEKEVTYNNHDEVTNVVITRTFTAKNENGRDTLKSIKQSAKDYNNDLISDAIKVSIKEDTDKKYIIVYYLDVLKMTDKELEYQNIKTDWLKYQNVLEKEKLSCKRKK